MKLGTIIALLFGLQPHTTGAYIFSLLFTFLGAAVFSLTRLREEKIPQEAVIGLIYALAASVAILFIDRAPHGAEHIKEILTGSILWVQWQSVLTAAIVYSAVGLFHYVFRERSVKHGGLVYGWNHFYREKPPGWVELINGTDRLYDLADFSTLFQSAAT